MLAQAQALAPELIRLRRDLHAHPELSFQEWRTSALVADTLQEIGLAPRTGIGRTGVVAEIGHGDGPIIAIRADMDALPIYEETGAEYASQHQGVMHACGHDAHTAILLGVAHLLQQSARQERWFGKVRLIFQPSEEAQDEKGISGGLAMVQDGVMEGVEAIIALHVYSQLTSGVCVFSDGYAMAAADGFVGRILGTGGHGAYPHTGSDPIYLLSHILPALYAIPSRFVNPLQSAVVSVGEVRGGSADNVIPNTLFVQGTIRAYDEGVRQSLWREVENAFRLSTIFGGDYQLEIKKGYPALYNAPSMNALMRQSAADLGVAMQVLTEPFGMGAEDFAYMAAQVPGAMFMLGAALPDSAERAHHTSLFDIDESALPIGAAVLAETARRFVTTPR